MSWTVRGSNPGGGARFSLPAQTGPVEPTKPPIHWVAVLSRGKAAGTWLWPPTQSTAEGKERVELYLFSPPEP